MKLALSILIFLAGFGSEADAQSSAFAAGRAYYQSGEFKKAASRFRLALKDNPSDAESYYWAGMSYEMLGDIATPFSRCYYSKARTYLTRAVDLAPNRAEYRQELVFLRHDPH